MKNIEIFEDNNDEDLKIKETKLVDLSRLRIVKDIHINAAPFNRKSMKEKREKVVKHLKESNGVYPKEEAILVWKSKDPEDRRRIIYNIEDGYRRYVISNEIGLEKVYVKIIDDKAKASRG